MPSLRVVLAFFALSCATGACATAQRTFVATSGSDAHACTLAQPCRSFTRAITQTSAGGEIVVLDSGGYGPVTIPISVSIIAPSGIHAGITVTSGDGVTINAPGSIVVLRGLAINGQGGATGVNLQSAGRVRIHRCTISLMGGNGLTHTAAGAELTVTDTAVRDNGGNGIGIAADAAVVLDRVTSEHNAFHGLYISAATASGEATATIADSAFAFNNANGIWTDASSNQTVNVVVERTVISNNGNDGFRATVTGSAHALYVSLARNTIHHNKKIAVDLVGGPIEATVAYNHISRSAGSFGHVYAGGDVKVVADANMFGPYGFTPLLSDFYIATGATLYTRQNNGGRNSVKSGGGTITPLSGE